jgi:transmembrane sensor
VQWVKASPEHLEQFLLLTAFETEAAGFRTASEFDLDSLIAMLPPTVRLRPVAPSAKLETVSLPQARSAYTRAASTTRVGIAAAISLALLAALLTWRTSRPNYATYATKSGERRAYVLQDGSRLQLNTDSAVKLHFTPHRRQLTLMKGEAEFQVAPDPARSFEVDVGPLAILDVDTVFTVRADTRRVSVYVIDGRVRLSAAQHPLPARAARATTNQATVDVAPGEASEVSITRGTLPEISPPSRLSPAQADARLAWTRGLLYLVNAPLIEVVREINRYHSRKIVIADPALEQFKLGGTLDPTSNDYQVIVSILANNCPIDVDQSQASVVTLRRTRATERCSVR